MKRGMRATEKILTKDELSEFYQEQRYRLVMPIIRLYKIIVHFRFCAHARFVSGNGAVASIYVRNRTIMLRDFNTQSLTYRHFCHLLKIFQVRFTFRTQNGRLFSL